MKKPFALFYVPLVTLALSGCMYDHPRGVPPGQYQQTTKSVDSHGTERQIDTSTNVYYDQYGNKKAVVDEKTSTDPKGLHNKSTTETRTTTQ